MTSTLDFYRNPAWMKQFPFAHTMTMTYRLQDGALEVVTRIDNLSNDPMPVAIGFHPYFQLTDSPRDEWTLGLDARARWRLAPNLIPTGETEPIEQLHPDPKKITLKDRDFDDVFGDLIRDQNGRAVMTMRGVYPAARRGLRPELPRVGHLLTQDEQLRRDRTDGGHHRFDEPRAEGDLQGAAEHSSRRSLAGELLDPAARVLNARTGLSRTDSDHTRGIRDQRSRTRLRFERRSNEPHLRCVRKVRGTCT